ncbi:MAG: hypothetical protein JST11_17110 [Acidobacteria bacterium]|nr:hypothetical protein [Acidobacteriota bacterium]
MVAIAIGCAVSLLARGALTPRLALPAAIYWSFVPLLQIAGLAAALRRRPDAATIDAFFRGFGPWLLWLASFAAPWTFVPAPTVFGEPAYPSAWWVAGALAGVWSLWIDFRFFLPLRDGSRAHAARDVIVHRMVCWPAGLVIFVAPAGWQMVESWFRP